jgi:septal ring-binding cell division protein DamX
VFFGLGYSMGRKSAQPATVISSESTAPGSTFSSFKPSAGSPATQPAPARKSPQSSAPAQPAPAADPDGEIVTAPVSPNGESSAAPRPAPAAGKDTAAESGAPIVRQAPHSAQSAPQPQPPNQPLPAISPNGTSIVQVAAVSHKEDADTLISALKKRGYNVFIRQEPQDNLLHVQLGPFATKKEAEAMRQHLLSDGYNAIVK